MIWGCERRPIWATRPKGHYFWDTCAQSGFADYMAAGTRWVLDDLGFCGCYTDGLAQVYPCQNTHHGCGYYDSQGVLHSTWPLFATREMLKRMYRLIHARRPDGYLVNHVSFNSLIRLVQRRARAIRGPAEIPRALAGEAMGILADPPGR